MGRKSRAKRERRERDADPMAQLVRQLDSPSALALLDAASVSPTASHCGLSIAALFHALTQRGRTGTERVLPTDLQRLVQAVHDARPEIASLEDFQPYDGRLEVLVPWGRSLFRLLPGSLERPTAVVRHHVVLASVIDRAVLPLLGFGLFDVGEIVLRRLDAVARDLSPVWPSGPASEVGDSPQVGLSEVEAAAGLPPIAEIVEACTYPERAAAALKRYTVAPKKLSFDFSHPVTTFGSAIATRVNGRVVPVPAGCLIESLLAIGAELAQVALSADPRIEERFTGCKRSSKTTAPVMGL